MADDISSLDDSPFADSPFNYRPTRAGLLQLLHRGRIVKTLRGRAADRLLEKLGAATPEQAQLLLARATGQFKFGNERAGRDHRPG